MHNINSHIDFVRYCINDRKCAPSIEDWDALFLFMKEQSLLGVGFLGIEKMKKEGVEVPRKLLLKWYNVSERIKQANLKANKVAAGLTIYFQKAGFRSCILKGQGNFLNYPAPYIRTSGDIDIWIEGGYNKIMSFVNSRWPGMLQRYHHVEIPAVHGIAVEIHFTPSFMYSPLLNRRIQKWFQEEADTQFKNVVELPDNAGSINAPTAAFNFIYQLGHIYRHLFSEGIGLRQLMDYYFLIRHEQSAIDKEKLQKSLAHFGLLKFAGAVMWVLQEVFGLDENEMLTPPNADEGKFLLNEILIGGNFGKYDTRLGQKADEGKVFRYFRMSVRALRFVRHYPTEALCEPIFRTWQFFWRITHT